MLNTEVLHAPSEGTRGRGLVGRPEGGGRRQEEEENQGGSAEAGEGAGDRSVREDRGM